MHKQQVKNTEHLYHMIIVKYNFANKISFRQVIGV